MAELQQKQSPETKTAINLDDIVRYCQKTFSDWQVPGAAIAIVNQGKVILEQGFGTCHHLHANPVTPHTIFPIASISKGFAATSIAMLVEQGYLKWTDHVIDHIPDFQLYDAATTSDFQIIDLFCHRSGLAPATLEQMVNWGYSRKDIQQAIAHVPPITPFRSAYAYNNVPYLWVEDLIEKYTDKSWADFISEHIFKPLGMNESYVGLKGQKSDNLATGHIFDEETKTTLTDISFGPWPDTCPTGAGIVSNVHDLAQWMLMQLGHFSLVSEKNRLFMHSPQISTEPGITYGIGWRIKETRPYRLVSHGGLIQGIKHLMTLVPELDCGVVILTNFTDSEAPLAIAEYFADSVMALPIQDYSDKYLKESPVEASSLPSLVNSQIDLSTYADTYHSPILGIIKVEEKDNKLLMLLGPKSAIAELQPIGKDTFRIYFLDEAGANYGEAHWGTAKFENNLLALEGYDNFEREKFILNKM